MEIKRTKAGVDIVSTASGSFGMYLNTIDNDISSIFNMNGSWEVNPTVVGGVRVVPHGWNNNLPADIRNLLEKK